MMRRSLGVVLIFLAGSAGAADTPEAEVRKAEEARIAATIKGDVAALGALLADGMTYVHSNAKLETKQEFIGLIGSGHYQYKSIAPRDVTVRFYGQTAIVGGLADIEVVSGGQPASPKLRFTEVWVKGTAGWQLAAWHSTRLPAP
jgi:ketosteroid isomerase-like protein